SPARSRSRTHERPARRLHNLPVEPRPSREEAMPDTAVREAFRRTREAFNRDMRLEAKGDPERSRALREYVNAQAELTRLCDEDLRKGHGARACQKSCVREQERVYPPNLCP